MEKDQLRLMQYFLDRAQGCATSLARSDTMEVQNFAKEAHSQISDLIREAIRFEQKLEPAQAA